MATDTVPDCVFCGIANGGANLIWENDYAVAFNSIDPKTPVHILVVPKIHVETLDDLDNELAGQMLIAVRDAARATGVNKAYKLAVNSGRGAGQVVPHLHFHILGRKDGSALTLNGVEL
jgi:histidine triad (HIT) family protein